MAFAKDVRDITIKNLAEIRKIDKSIDQLKEMEREQIYTKQYVNSKIAKLKAQRNQVIKSGKEQVAQMAEAYRAEVHAEFFPKGEDLTADAALFNSGFSLSASQLEELAEKYANNPTMTQLIYNYADLHKMPVTKPRYSEVEKAALADTLLGYYSSAMQRPYFPEWESDSYFEQITGEV